MRRTARKLLVAGITGSVLTLGLPVMSADADPGDSIIGRCSAVTAADPTITQGQNQGTLQITAEMLTSAHEPDGRAEVDCKIQVNGQDAPGTELDQRAQPTGLVVGQLPIIFDDQGGTLPSALCENDKWGDGDTTGWVCKPFAPVRVPPGQLNDLITTLFETVICPVLTLLGLGGCTL